MGILTFIPLMSFLIGSCWIIIVCIKDISNDLSFLKPDEISNKSAADLKEPFCNIVKLYSDVKELSKIVYKKLNAK